MATIDFKDATNVNNFCTALPCPINHPSATELFSEAASIFLLILWAWILQNSSKAIHFGFRAVTMSPNSRLKSENEHSTFQPDFEISKLTVHNLISAQFGDSLYIDIPAVPLFGKVYLTTVVVTHPYGIPSAPELYYFCSRRKQCLLYHYVSVREGNKT